jgi:hypothetical protein
MGTVNNILHIDNETLQAMVDDINAHTMRAFQRSPHSWWRIPRPEKGLALPDQPWLRDTLISQHAAEHPFGYYIYPTCHIGCPIMQSSDAVHEGPHTSVNVTGEHVPCACCRAHVTYHRTFFSGPTSLSGCSRRVSLIDGNYFPKEFDTRLRRNSLLR